MTRHALPLIAAGLLAACASTPRTPAPVDVAALEREVAAAETAFAKTMADRDLAAFASHIAEDAIFSPGPNTLRGKAAIVRQLPHGVGRRGGGMLRVCGMTILRSGRSQHRAGGQRDRDGHAERRQRGTAEAEWRQHREPPISGGLAAHVCYQHVTSPLGGP